MPNETIRVAEKDNVAVVLRACKKGERVAVEGAGDIRLLDDVEANHKIALADIPKGGRVVKYGHGIGTATEDIKTGQWVHTHNLGE